jgi:hypothetical protein
MLVWDWYGFHKKRVGTRYTKLMFSHPVGYTGHVVHSGASGREMSTHHFSCSRGTGSDFTKNTPGDVTLNLVLHPVGFAGHVVHSGASEERNVNALFMLVWTGTDLKKKRRDTLHRTCVLYPVGYIGHVVHSGASGERNVDALHLILVWDRYGFQKKCTGTTYAKLVFCIRRYL